MVQRAIKSTFQIKANNKLLHLLHRCCIYYLHNDIDQVLYKSFKNIELSWVQLWYDDGHSTGLPSGQVVQYIIKPWTFCNNFGTKGELRYFSVIVFGMEQHFDTKIYFFSNEFLGLLGSIKSWKKGQNCSFYVLTLVFHDMWSDMSTCVLASVS
jgi:hypothetical protein